MKTTKQWFDMLDPDTRKKAIKYTRINYGGRMPPYKCNSFLFALISAFPWDYTEEGFYYWKKILQNIVKYENNN